MQASREDGNPTRVETRDLEMVETKTLKRSWIISNQEAKEQLENKKLWVRNWGQTC
jgi:hypothetical protein